MLNEILTAASTKVAAAAFTAVATVGTGAAAVTGNLPDDVQDQVAEAAEHVGLDLPDSSEDVRQDAENRADGDVEAESGEGTDTDDAVLDTLSGDSGTTPEDGEEFGEAVSDNATTGDLGDEVSTTASDGAADQGTTTADDASTAGDDAATEGSDAADGDYPEDAPSDSGEQDAAGDQDAAGSDADSNPGDEHRPE